MRFSAFTFLAALVALSSAAPATTIDCNTLSTREADKVNPSVPFYLVTTSQQSPSYNSSLLANVSATSLFDPFYQATYLLRLIGPGYGSLPKFTLSHTGILSTKAAPPHETKKVTYSSLTVKAGQKLGFEQTAPSKGNLGLQDDYLLTVNGKAKGWTLCPGDFSETILEWQGTADACKATFVQAVTKPPY